MTKSWRVEPKKCNSSTPTPPWLQLFHDDYEGADKQPHIFGTNVKRLEVWYCFYWRLTRWPPSPSLHFLGFSHVLVVGKEASVSDYNLWDPVDGSGCFSPSWMPGSHSMGLFVLITQEAQCKVHRDGFDRHQASSFLLSTELLEEMNMNG